jgi:hypothetical protein
MPEKSTPHHRFDTIVAVAAFFVSFIALYFSWQANQREEDSIKLSSISDSNCKLEIFGSGDNARLGLCWIVTMYNQSKNTVTIDFYDVVDENFDYTASKPPGYVPLEDMNGKPLQPPIAIDGGKFEKVLVRKLVAVSQPLTKLVDTASRSPTRFRTLRDLILAAAAQGTDIMGNKLVPSPNDQFEIITTAQLVVETARGKRFSEQMIYLPFAPGQRQH